MDFDEFENDYNLNNDNDDNENEEDMGDNYEENDEEINEDNYMDNNMDNYIDNNLQEDNNDYNNFNNEDENGNFDENENFNENGNENYNENDLYAMNMENIKLKDKNQKLTQLLYQKNNEITNLKANFSNQYQIMNQNLNKYKMIAQKYASLQNEINMTKQKYLKEIKMKNKIISDLQKGVEVKDLKISNLTLEENQNSNLIFTIVQQIKSIQQNFLEEPDSDKLNQEDFQKLDNDQQIQFLLNEIKIFSEKLMEYKNINMLEVVRLRNILDSTNKKYANIKDQNYSEIIDLKKALTNNNINDINFPECSLNDDEEKRKNNLFNIIKSLVKYIINNKNIKENNNNIDEELKKRLKEMSELLSKNSQNLSISTKNNAELKAKYDELKEKYDNLEKTKETEKKKLINDLNKKNQQIKSLEHINTRLSNQINENKIEDQKVNNRKPLPKYGKIAKGKNNKRTKENNIGTINLFIKDDKSEKDLELFLNKFTNGEYGTFDKDNNNINNNENIDLEDLKNEIDEFNKKLNKDLNLEDKK